MRTWAEIKMHCWQRAKPTCFRVCDVHSQQTTTTEAQLLYIAWRKRNCGHTGHWGIHCRSRGCFKMQEQTPHQSLKKFQCSVKCQHPFIQREVTTSNSPTENQRDHILGISRHRIGEEQLYLKGRDLQTRIETSKSCVTPNRHRERNKETVFAGFWRDDRFCWW